MNKYKWIIKEQISEAAKQQFPEVGGPVLQLLFERGLTTQEGIDEFLHPDYSQDIHDPRLFSQMEAAVNRLYQARDKKEKIAIYGDYDADGVCGSAILNKIFTKLNFDFVTYLPDREKDGYGLNNKAIGELADQGVKLIITVDCGISNNPEVDFANGLGLNVILTDHHHVPEVTPNALAIIHPAWDKNYPFKQLSGGGVAFKLAQGLIADERSALSAVEGESFAKWLLDLVAISTVADMVPLLGENRTLVKYGLIVLAKTKNLGLDKLMEVGVVNREKIDTHTISFQIAPRINAAGRMSHANNAYQLVTTQNIEEAITIATQLNKRNLERQSMTEKLVAEAKEQLGEVGSDKPVLFVVGENWNPGLIGLVASKLTQDFARPAFVLSDDGNRYVASGRSIKEFNLIESMDKFSNYFLRYGGHSGAAGFSMNKDQLEGFKEKFSAYGAEKLAGFSFTPSILIDMAILLAQADWELVEFLDAFSPYGEGNLKPRFLIKNLEIISADIIGSDKSHLRLLVTDGKIKRKIICFGFGFAAKLINPGEKIDIVAELSVNEWNGNREIQLSMLDVKKANGRN